MHISFCFDVLPVQAYIYFNLGHIFKFVRYSRVDHTWGVCENNDLTMGEISLYCMYIPYVAVSYDYCRYFSHVNKY